MTALAAIIGSTELPLAAEIDVESLVWAAQLRAGGRGDTPRVTRQVWPDARTLPLPVVIEADDGPAIEAVVSAINRELAKANTLVLTSDDGLAGTFQTYPSDPLPPTAGALYRYGGTYKGTAQVRVEPFCLGATTAIAAADLVTPAMVDLSSMDGEYPARLTVAIAPNAGTMHGLWLALCPDPTWDGFVVDAVDVPGWDDEVADAGLGVNVVRFAAGAGVDAGTVDTADFPASAYLVLARVKSDAGTLTMSTDYTGDVTQTVTNYNWLPVGELAAPTRRVRGAATAPLTVNGASVTGAAYCHRLAFLPLRWGFLSYHDAGGSASTISSLRGEWEDVYLDDVVNYEHVLGGGLRTLGGGLIVVSEDAAGTTVGHTIDVDASFRPRRNWLG